MVKYNSSEFKMKSNNICLSLGKSIADNSLENNLCISTLDLSHKVIFIQNSKKNLNIK